MGYTIDLGTKPSSVALNQNHAKVLIKMLPYYGKMDNKVGITYLLGDR